MITASSLKQDLRFNRDFGDIIEVLKASAVIQFRAMQLRQKPNDEFSKGMELCFGLLARKKIRHRYMEDNPALPSLITIITSDAGFLGELNILLVNAALDERRSREDEFIVIGEQGARYFSELGVKFLSLPGFSDRVSYSELEGVRDYLFEGYGKKFGRVKIIYPRYVSLTVQRIEVFQILPYASGVSPQGRPGAMMEGALIGPSESRLLERLIELWGGFKAMEIAWSSKQAEYAARIMHLEGSTQELAHINQRIAFNYFRLVHTMRDRSIREISASKLLLEKK